MGRAGVLLLGEGVEESAEHGDGRPHVTQERSGRTENDTRRHDDHHALGGRGREGGREGVSGRSCVRGLQGEEEGGREGRQTYLEGVGH